MNFLARYARSSTFRLAAFYLLLFQGSVCAVLGFVYWATAHHFEVQAVASIEQEIDSLADHYRARGLPGFSRMLSARVARSERGPFVYLFGTAGGRTIAGNLSGWPEAATRSRADGWIEFPLWSAREPDDTPHKARARVMTVPGGLRLLVGRDMHEIDRARHRIEVVLWWSIGLTSLLALAGAFAMSRGTLRRIDAINRASREIMRGDLGRRIPTRGTRDDFDRLAAQLNAMLDRIQELMDGVRRVTDDIAHDLRTPLTRLRAHLEELRDADAATPEARASVEAALQESERLFAMFSALLRIARIESRTGGEEFAPVDLAALAREVVEFYEPLAEEEERVLEAGVGAEPLWVTGDRDLLFQVVANLVDNALRHGWGRVLVEVERVAGTGEGVKTSQDGFARVAVRDEGTGIPAPERERVFGRFVRLEASRNTPGNGLGLALVRAVAALHEGTIELGENERSGTGTGLCATLVLPLADAHSGSARSG